MNFEDKIITYYKKNKKKGINNALSSISHLSSSYSTIGYSKLNFFKKKKFSFLKFTIKFFKHLISIGYQSKFKLIGNVYNSNNSKLILTWAYKKNFANNGSLNDRYFNLNSKKKDFLWLVLYLDKNLPKKLNKNIIIFHVNKTNFNFKYFFLTVFKILFKNNFNFIKSFHYLSGSSNLAFYLINKISEKVNLKKIKKIITPYEGQPFQQYLFYFLENKFRHVQKIGYLSHTHPLQYDIFFREGAPNYLMTHSPDQIKYIVTKLNWPKKRVKLISSLRYTKKSFHKNSIKNKILLPYDFESVNNMLLSFENFLLFSKNDSLPNLKVKKHPAPYNMQKQTKLEKGLKSIIKKYQFKFNKKLKKNLSLVMGLSSSVLTALECGAVVIHILEDKFFEGFDKKIWPNIISSEISNNVILYKLKKYNKCILFGKKENFNERNF